MLLVSMKDDHSDPFRGDAQKRKYQTPSIWIEVPVNLVMLAAPYSLNQDMSGPANIRSKCWWYCVVLTLFAQENEMRVKIHPFEENEGHAFQSQFVLFISSNKLADRDQ